MHKNLVHILNSIESVNIASKTCTPETSLRREHWISLVGFQALALMCRCTPSVMLLTLAVFLPTPHYYSGTFQGGNSARLVALRRVLKGARRVLYPS